MSKTETSQRSRGAADLAVGFAALALGGGALLLVPTEVSRDGFQSFGNVRSAAFFPILSAGLLTVFACALLTRSYLSRLPDRPDVTAPSGRVLAIAGILLAGGAAMTWLGFLLTSAALIVALSYAFGARRHAIVLALALAVPLAILTLFRSVLDVLLPSGVLF